MNILKLLVIFCSILLFFSCDKGKESETKEDEFTLEYEKFTLDNGLEVILHVDKSDPIVAVATVMHVGSNREKPGKTGFAHFFEHMAFNDSENVPVGANRKMIPEWGGSRNGGTWNDGTIYYEVVPKDAFEKILWIDSDRFGYMINTVTEAALEREKQVVKNEKRQRVDNAPYGYTDEIIRANLYPEDHPYNWTVIGSLPDLQAATLDDVKEFYNEYYGAANATLVIAGDIDVDETKKLVEKWFGEIPRGPEVNKMDPMPVTLETPKLLSFEDNFAKLPELRMIFPSVEEYNKDQQALEVLGQLLSGSKKAHLYKAIVEEKKLAPNVFSYQSSNELAGEFVIRIRANEGADLDDVKSTLDEAFVKFETEGFTDSELERIKAELETQLYYGVSTILNKAFQLAQDNEFGGDPAFTTKRAKLTQKITREDVMRVYNTYIKDKNFIITSVVPKGNADLAVSESQPATVWEEEVTAMSASEEVGQGEEAAYEKTPSKHDRSEPPFGETPLFKMPTVWTDESSNGMSIFGVEDYELPLVAFEISIKGGQLLDTPEKAGIASFTAQMLNEGTTTKTAAELEEAIGLLGASINVRSGLEEITISGTTLARNLEETLVLVEEMLLNPRWDENDFEKIKQEILTSIKGREANPNVIASMSFDKLIYGEDHIFSLPGNGTQESITGITLEDLKQFYNNLSPKMATFHVVGAVDKSKMSSALSGLEKNWRGEEISIPMHNANEEATPGTLYFIDFPNAKQSVLYIGKQALSASSEEAVKLNYANEILGGGSSGMLFQTLRIEKGYTYGAYSYIPNRNEIAPFILNSSVRSNATLPSLEIIEEMLSNYGPNFTDEDVNLTKNKLIKQNTRSYESLGAKLNILKNISKYNKSLNYIEEQQQVLQNMTLSDFQAIIDKYIQEEEMIYIVVGDKATQFNEVKKLDKPIVELDIYGNTIN